MRHPLLLLTGAMALASLSLAQSVPYGQSVISVLGNQAPSEGLFFVDRLTGTSTLLTGLVAAGSAGNGINAIALDPIDDRIWLGGINNNGNTANQLNWIRLTGSTVTQFQQFATIAPTTAVPINAIVFDDNANPIFCAGTAAGLGGVFLANRRSGGPAVNIGAVPSGTHNALAKDSAGNLYVGMFGNGQIHQMLKNPDGSFQPPVPWGTVSNSNIFALAFAPADGVSPDQLFVSCGGPASPLVSVIPVPAGGPGTAVPQTQTILNWIEYDRRNNDLLLVQSSPDRLIRMNRTGGDAIAAVIGNSNVGTPTCLDVNNAVDAEVVVAPMILNGSLGPFDLELGTTAPPGSLVLIGTASPFVAALAVGVADVDGKLFVKFPNLSIASSLAPGSLLFVAAYFDASLNLILGAPVSWPAL